MFRKGARSRDSAGSRGTPRRSHLENLFDAPSSLNEDTQARARSAREPTLSEVFDDAAVAAAFAAQDVGALSDASELSIDEIRQVLERASLRATVGAVRAHRNALQAAAAASATSFDARHDATVRQTADSVFARATLRLGPRDLKDALIQRLSAESIFASLMLTIAAAALIEAPDEHSQACDDALGHLACARLRCAYLFTWGFASAFFTTACIVSLGAMQLFYGPATIETVHFVFAGSEAYVSLSHLYISIGFVLGLLPGACVNVLLRFPESMGVASAVGALHVAVWVWQFVRGRSAIARIYGRVPGFTSIWQFFTGYVAVTATLRAAGDDGGGGAFSPSVAGGAAAAAASVSSFKVANDLASIASADLDAANDDDDDDADSPPFPAANPIAADRESGRRPPASTSAAAESSNGGSLELRTTAADVL